MVQVRALVEALGSGGLGRRLKRLRLVFDVEGTQALAKAEMKTVSLFGAWDSNVRAPTASDRRTRHAVLGQRRQ